MHPTAHQNCKDFQEAYHEYMLQINPDYEIVEIGSLDKFETLRKSFPPGFKYTGVDIVAGPNVDIVLDDPYTLPFKNESVDMVICSSVFEQVEMFWVLYVEIMRVLKPHGLLYINVASNGDINTDIDCWRFYPHSGRALQTWSNRCGIPSMLLESYTSAQNKGIWNDYVAVFVKDETYASQYEARILHTKQNYWNGLTDTQTSFMRGATISEDQKKHEVIKKILNGEIPVS